MKPAAPGDGFDGQEHAGHERGPVQGVVAQRQHLARRAQQDLLVCHQAPQADGMDLDPGGRFHPPGRCFTVPTGGAPVLGSPVLGSPCWARECWAPRAGKGPDRAASRAAAMRRAVCNAVPEGESSLPSWCSSITSTVSNQGAASSAKRIMSTAPMAKLGAKTQLAGPGAKVSPPPAPRRPGRSCRSRRGRRERRTRRHWRLRPRPG